MTLLDCTKNHEGGKLLFASQGKTLTVDDILSESYNLSQFRYGLCDKAVALVFQSNIELAKWMIFLDGVVNRITIIPPDISIENRASFLTLSGTETVLFDHDNQLTGFSSVYNINRLNIHNSADVPIPENLTTEWVVATSGTTGSPKLVKHDFNSLTNTVKKGNGTDNRWGLLYGLHRFAGIQVFLQALTSANALVITEPEETLSEKIKLLTRNRVNCLSATPTLWRKILMLTESQDLKLSVITLGGEIVDSNILKALRQRFPLAKVRHIYATTEAGTCFSVSDGLSGFPESYLQGILPDVSLKISNLNTLLIKSKSKSSGYIGNDLSSDDGYIDTGDLIQIRNNRCYFNGRENGSINVGGNKVQPEYVESVLMEFPGVCFANVTAKESSIVGNLVQASIVIDVLIDGDKDFIIQLREYCKSRLEQFMIPMSIKIVDDIHLNDTGKLIRK